MRNESAPHAFVRRTECVPYKQWIILSNFLWYMQFKLLRVICTLRSPNALVQVYSYISCYSFSLDVCSLYNTYIRNKLVLRNHFLWRPICHLLHKDKELLALRNNFRVTKKFLIAKFDCIIIKEAAATIKRQASLLKNYVKTLLTKYEFGKILWFFLFYITASKKSSSKIVRKRIKENIWYLLGTYAVRTDRKNVTNFLYLVLHLAHKVTLFSSVLVSVLRTSINVLSKCKSRNYVTWIANLTKLFLSVRKLTSYVVWM